MENEEMMNEEEVVEETPETTPGQQVADLVASLQEKAVAVSEGTVDPVEFIDQTISELEELKGSVAGGGKEVMGGLGGLGGGEFNLPDPMEEE